ncbi:cation:proton antiporter subunit C [Microbacterium sp. ACRRU]|jgi:multicomponent Na+:H+ antiporter subunit C|uniref:sodium:proton antiporter n=1 Tax=Microbacterium sp. ACRRU TaxID=2918204 RepID=UPI001EF3FDAA|nr:cation:proton antiporter subunit C [Microbacterium sp. ACRRU]MCG7418305.1 cation:proton antiporter subunit C [Microbacterium sp. ACRRU]
MILALVIGALVTAAVYLLLQKDRLRVIIGFVLLSHAVNLLFFSAGGIGRRGEPLGSDPDPSITADPLPQAFVLTAIVIAFAITIYLLVLAVTGSAAEDEGVDDDDEQPAPQRKETDR